MPDPPDSGALTQYLFENPWPLVGLLAVCGLVIGWVGLRDGRGSRTKTGFILLGLAVLSAFIGSSVVTPGEHAERITRELVDAVVAEDLVAVHALFDPGVRLHAAAPTNPGRPMDPFFDRLDRFVANYDIESNRITSLSGYTDDDDGVVHLTCFTDLGTGGGRTQWHLRVREIGGAWMITDLTWIGLNGSQPPLSFASP